MGRKRGWGGRCGEGVRTPRTPSAPQVRSQCHLQPAGGPRAARHAHRARVGVAVAVCVGGKVPARPLLASTLSVLLVPTHLPAALEHLAEGALADALEHMVGFHFVRCRGRAQETRQRRDRFFRSCVPTRQPNIHSSVWEHTAARVPLEFQAILLRRRCTYLCGRWRQGRARAHYCWVERGRG
jgi:hypothetical protein